MYGKISTPSYGIILCDIKTLKSLYSDKVRYADFALNNWSYSTVCQTPIFLADL